MVAIGGLATGFLGGLAGGSVVSVVIRGVDDFSKTFNTAESRLKRFGVSALKASTVAFTAFSAVTLAAGVAAVKSAGAFEQQAIAIEVMSGSAERARKLMSDLVLFAKKTPFEFTGLVSSTKQLLAFGVEAEDVLGIMGQLGDISSGLGRDKLPSLITAFGRVAQQGKVTGKELLILRAAGFDLREMAKTAGVSIEDLTSAVARGDITFEVFKETLNTLTSEGGRFFNLMDIQSRSLDGSFQNIGDSLGQIGRDIVGISSEGKIREGSVFSLLRDQALDLVKVLDENEDTIVGSLSRAADKFAGFAGDTITFFKELDPAIQKGIVTFGALGSVLVLVAGALGLIVTLVGAKVALIIAAITVLGAVIIAAKDAGDRMLSAFIEWAAGIPIVSDIVLFLVDAITSLQLGIDRVKEALIGWIKNAVTSTDKNVRLKASMDAAKKAAEEYGKKFGGLAKEANNAADGIDRVRVAAANLQAKLASFLGSSAGGGLSAAALAAGQRVLIGGNVRQGGNTAEAFGRLRGISVPSFNDFISRPGQGPVSFSPDDTIIGVKNPSKLGSSGVNVNIGNISGVGLTVQELARELQRNLENMVRA